MITQRKKEIIDTYKKTNNYVKTGKILNISKQRVHQVIKNYQNFGFTTRGRKLISRKAFKKICEKCKISPSKLLHHIDGDNTNDIVKNLISLCKDCHRDIHLKMRNGRGLKNHIFCLNCRKNFTLEFPHSAKGLCSYCLYRSHSPFSKKRIGKIDRENNCIDCKQSFNKEKPYYSKLRCYRCYSKYLYSTSIKRREYHRGYYLKKKMDFLP